LASAVAKAEAATKAAEAVPPRPPSAAQTVSAEPQWSFVAAASNSVSRAQCCLLGPVEDWLMKSSMSGHHVVRC
jgi:hypothetical protein